MDQLMAPSARLKGRWSSTNTSPTATAATIAAHRHAPPDGIVQPTVGQGQEEVERDRRHDEGGKRGDVRARCSTRAAISALRPAVSATAATRASVAARRWKGEALRSDGLGPGCRRSRPGPTPG